MQGFHLVQSFAAGEVTPELAHQIGLEFADRLLGGNFQAVVSTHLNTKMHSQPHCLEFRVHEKRQEIPQQ